MTARRVRARTREPVSEPGKPGQKVRVRPLEPVPAALLVLRGLELRVEGKAGRVGVQAGTPAALIYATRMALSGVLRAPLAEAIYGHDQQGIGWLIHPSEVEPAESRRES